MASLELDDILELASELKLTELATEDRELMADAELELAKLDVLLDPALPEQPNKATLLINAKANWYLIIELQ